MRILALILVFVCVPALVAQDLEYNRDIRPILTENCFACHGPDSAAREADLRLDQRDAALEMEAIVPGAPDDSSLWQRIISEDDSQMPPASSHKSLTASEKKLLRQWIEQGAEYQPHWAFIPPVKPELPKVAQANWMANPIDRFVAAELERRGLQPAPEADRRTLARRLALDITGLPPTPEMVQAFVDDPSSDAYENLVDRLLARPEWGEHRGRYWLDVARYADTHGIHFDNYREMWAYRDWVIDAFNQNMPFDQFTIEQLAGDLLPNPTLDQLVATGFNRCNITTNEGGIIDEEYKVLYARDRTETTAQAWMGLTVGCAVCHDHKFDPLSQREFYELSAFFNNTTQPVRDGNIKDTPPTVFVPAREDRTVWRQLEQEQAEARALLEQRKADAEADFLQWVQLNTLSMAIPPVSTADLHFQTGHQLSSIPYQLDGNDAAVMPQSDVAGPDATAIQEKGQQIVLEEVGKFESDRPFSFGGWIKFQGPNNSGSLFARMDESNAYRGWDFWCENGRVGTHLVNRWPDNALKVVTRDPLPSDQWLHVMVAYDGSRSANGVQVFVNGNAVPLNRMTDRLNDSIQTETPFKLFQRSNGSRVAGLSLADVRLYRRKLTDTEAFQLAKYDQLAAHFQAVKQGQPGEEPKAALYDWYLKQVDSDFRTIQQRLTDLANQENQLRQRGTKAHVMNERPEAPRAYVLYRGEYDQRRDEVGFGTPEMLPEWKEGLEPNRLGLARWLLQPQHPLTARVTVNRFWQSVFGQGIVTTSGDFGLTGTTPSHPDLLDWLAVDFRENQWDVKRFFKQIFMSQTYRQAAVVDGEKLEKDPDNTWLSRGPRFRMDAEMVRDYMLQVSGVLVKRLGGPSVKPYQPAGVWEAVAMPESNTKSYQRDSGDGLYRRSLYTFWKRAAPPAALTLFDAPNREVCTVRRERTNTPLQALATLNDPQYIEAARQLATRMLTLVELKDTTDRLHWLSQHVLCRPLETTEVEILNSLLPKLEAHYRDVPADAKQLISVGEIPVAESTDPIELAVWTMVVNQLMNLDETLCK